MSLTAVPTRITIDFRDALHPSRGWILGLAADPEGRVDLLAYQPTLAGSDGAGGPGAPLRESVRPVPPRRPTALSADCACPDYCERDHANE